MDPLDLCLRIKEQEYLEHVKTCVFDAFPKQAPEVKTPYYD